jgi:pyridoxal/pyridoxine/pyridoxamine kinase
MHVPQDRRLVRIDKQLASGISIVTASAHEAESLTDQTLANDLHEALAMLRKIHNAIGFTGQRYRGL